MHIRLAKQQDTRQIALLEQSDSSSWSSGLIEAEFRYHSGIQLVAVDENEIVGWCCARFLVPDADLLKITVGHPQRRKGIATALLYELFKHCRKSECKTISLEVRQNNSGAVTMYRRLKFKKKGMRRNYFQNPPDNGVILEKSLLSENGELQK